MPCGMAIEWTCMSTLTNVDMSPYSAETEETDKHYRPENSNSIIPKATSSQTGVSVEYVPNPNHEWFVVRASYGREQKASDYMVDHGTLTFLPRHIVNRMVNGKRVRVEEPLVPNILFAYTSREKADEYVKDTPQLSFLTYYYDHFRLEEGKNPPLVVPNIEMRNFVLATTANSAHVRVVQPDQCHFKSGDIVKVIDGPFVGVRGRVARVAGQQRVVVTVKGLCSVATAYVPSAFLQIDPTAEWIK